MFKAALFPTAKILKKSKYPWTDGWRRRCSIYIFITEYYSAIKNEILLFAITWMDLEGIMLSKMSQRKTNTI